MTQRTPQELNDLIAAEVFNDKVVGQAYIAVDLDSGRRYVSSVQTDEGYGQTFGSVRLVFAESKAIEYRTRADSGDQTIQRSTNPRICSYPFFCVGPTPNYIEDDSLMLDALERLGRIGWGTTLQHDRNEWTCCIHNDAQEAALYGVDSCRTNAITGAIEQVIECAQPLNIPRHNYET